MKKIVLYLTLIASLNSCSQKKETNMEITANNIVEKTVAQIKHYPKEPMYYIYVGNSLCVYEILVNDWSVYKNYKYEQLGTPIYINGAILKSGQQKITCRVYPAPKEFNGGKDVFDTDTQFQVTVYQQDFKKTYENSEVLVKKEETPVIERKMGVNENERIKEFAHAGKKSCEITFYFDAEVPYQNKGWSDGEDLREINQEQLKKAVEKFYLSRKKIILDKNMDAFANQVFEAFKEQFISEYQNKDYIYQAWEEWISKYKNPTYQLQPLDNYKICFFGEGKIVCLRQMNNDPRYREKSALFGKYKDEDGNTRADFHNLYLYLPKGKSLDYLQVIR